MNTKDINPFYAIDDMVVPEVRPIDNLRFQKTLDHSHDDEPSYVYVSDVTLLLNSERLRNVLGDDSVNALVSSIGASGTASASSPYTKPLNDDALLKTIKPRYVQSLSEIRDYVDTLKEAGEDILRTAEEARQAAEAAALAQKAAELASGSVGTNPQTTE